MDKVTYISSSITLLDRHSLISVKVGEERPGKSRGKGKEGERRVKNDKAEKDININL